MFCIFFIPFWKVEGVFFVFVFNYYVFGCLSEKSYGNTVLELLCYTQTMGCIPVCIYTCLCHIELVLKELSPFGDSGPVVNKSNAPSSSLKLVIYSATNCFVIRQIDPVDLCPHSRNTFETRC